MMAELLRQSVLTPRAAAARIVALGLTLREGLEAQLLVSAIGGLMVGLVTRGRLEVELEDGSVFTFSPLAYAGLLAACLLVTAVALTASGRALGGRGQFPEALALVAWLQAVDLVLQAVLLLVAVLLPPLVPIAAMLALGVFIWTAIGFAQELHDISPGRAAGALVLAALGLGFALAVVLGLAWSPADA